MKLLIVAFASVLFCVQRITAEDTEDEKKLISNLVKAVPAALKQLAAAGQKYSPNDAAAKLISIVNEEILKDLELFRKIGSENVEKVIGKVMQSPEVQTAFNDILAEGVQQRVIGAVVMGLTQLITDFVTMLLTRNA